MAESSAVPKTVRHVRAARDLSVPLVRSSSSDRKLPATHTNQYRELVIAPQLHSGPRT